jgi:tetratricopeptide (TPR) repeat protein
MSTFGRILVVTLVLGTCSAGVAANAWAQGHESAATAAKAHFKEGRAHYQLGEYSAAIKEFKEAYHLKTDATFLFNIAQCHRQLHEYGEALRLYRNYLRDAPDAPNREDVEKFIREITLLVEQEKEARAAVAPTPAPVAAVPPSLGSTPGAPQTGAPALAAESSAAPAPPVTAAQPRAESTTAVPEQPLATAAPPKPVRAEAEVEVVTSPSESTIMVNKTTVGSQSPVKLALAPGLYSVAIERDGYRGAEGAVSLLAGDHVSVKVDLKPVKTHGWRGLGTTFVVIGVLGEAAGIGGHVTANKKFAGSPEYNNFSKMETIGQAVAISSAVLAVGCYVLDWLGNRRNVDPGPPFMLEPVKVNP